MNIIITTFAEGRKNPLSMATGKTTSALNAGDRAMGRAENNVDKGQEKVEKAMDKGVINGVSKPTRKPPPPPPSRNNPRGVSNQQPMRQPPPMPNVMGFPGNNKEIKFVSNNPSYLDARKNNPQMVAYLDNNANQQGDTSVPIGELKTDKQDYAMLPEQQRYNIISNISSANASSPSDLARLSGVYRA